jgi:hypothetical protein
LLTGAKTSALAYTESVLLARESATYSLIAHPVLLDNINGAVLSILWYLALLVPFTFFMEKLLFAFPDIRKQLAAQAVIFLLVFAMLRFLHPAFELIRSSVMILLGFVILLISGGVTILFAGKFRENLAALEAMRGRAVGVVVEASSPTAEATGAGTPRGVRPSSCNAGELLRYATARPAFDSPGFDESDTRPADRSRGVVGVTLVTQVQCFPLKSSRACVYEGV